MLPLHHRTGSVKLVEWLADADVPVTVMVYVPDGVPPWGVRVVWPSPRPPCGKSDLVLPGRSSFYPPACGSWIMLQYRRKPARCQPTTASGATAKG